MANVETVPIETTILVVRELRVILAGDLAKIYGVETRVLNQAVKRNRERFPEDFTFRLTRDEATEIARQEYQISPISVHRTRCDHGSECAQ